MSSSSDGNSKSIPLILFGIDCTRRGQKTKYAILAIGLFVFTCGYGYYQELVVYSWFKRKLGLFTTMLYFVGSALCALLEKFIYTGTSPIERKSPWSYHILLSILKCGSQTLTNVSMGHINYPAKVLFKSAIPVAQMAIGSVWLRKSYPIRDHIVIGLLMLGIYVFISGNPKQPDANMYGIILIILSVIGAAAVPMVQDHCMTTYHSKPTEMLYFSFMGGAMMSALTALLSGEFHIGMSFLLDGDETILNPLNTNISHYKPVEYPWFALCMFCTLGYFGAHCSTALTQHFGALLNGITNTARKATSVALSFIYFPDEHQMTLQLFIGCIIFFSGLAYRASSKGLIVSKSNKEYMNYGKVKDNEENDSNSHNGHITNNNINDGNTKSPAEKRKLRNIESLV